MNAQEHRNNAEQLIWEAEDQNEIAQDAVLGSFQRQVAVDKRDYLIARAHVHAILAKGWN